MSEWHPIASAPFDCDLRLCVIEGGEVHELVFPCRRTWSGWAHVPTGRLIYLDPTHCRLWDAD
jgi:hypothetical protein